jgi:hypothetical protein
VHFDRNRYSVPCEAAGKVVQIKAYAGRLKVVEGGKLLAEHKREFGRDKTVYDPWHYVPLLDRKPGALRNDAQFTAWKLPEAIEQIREVLRRYDDWDRPSSPGFSPPFPAMVSTWSPKPVGWP